MIDTVTSTLSAIPPLYLAIAAGVVVVMLLSRLPIIGTAIRIAMWFAMAVVLVTALGQRERLNPYFGKVADRLNLDDQKVVGGEVRIRMARDGHFWARVKIGDVERRMLVDSGATVTALSTDTAAEAGLKVRDAMFPVLIRTANGTIQARTSSVPELRLGAIVARKLEVIVSPSFAGTDVLGMNFLSRLQSWRVEGQTLILVPHHPQADEGDAPAGAPVSGRRRT